MAKTDARNQIMFSRIVFKPMHGHKILQDNLILAHLNFGTHLLTIKNHLIIPSVRNTFRRPPVYHTNLKTGNIGRCSASPGNCPFGAEDKHYSSVMDAKNAIEKVLENQYLNFDKVQKVATPLQGTLMETTDFSSDEAKILLKDDRRKSAKIHESYFTEQPLQVEPMTTREDRAMGEYKWSGYGWMNRYLRGDKSVTQESLGMGINLTMVSDLQNFIKRQVPMKEQFTLYRAGDFPEINGLSEDELLALERGETRDFELQGFVSTSSSEAIFRNFQSKCRMKITVMPGTRLLDVSKHLVGGATLAHERELLLPHGSKVRVTSFKRDGARRLIELQVLPND